MFVSLQLCFCLSFLDSRHHITNTSSSQLLPLTVVESWWICMPVSKYASLQAERGIGSVFCCVNMNPIICKLSGILSAFGQKTGGTATHELAYLLAGGMVWHAVSQREIRQNKWPKSSYNFLLSVPLAVLVMPCTDHATPLMIFTPVGCACLSAQYWLNDNCPRGGICLDGLLKLGVSILLPCTH